MKYLYVLVGLLCVTLLLSGCVGSDTGTELASGDVKKGDNYSSADALSDWKNIVAAVGAGKTVSCEYDIEGQTFTLILTKYKNFMKFYGLEGTSAMLAQTEFKDNKMTTYVWQETGSLIPDEYLAMYEQYGVEIPEGKKVGTKSTTPSTEEIWKSTWNYDPDSEYSSTEAQFNMSWKCVTSSYSFELPGDVYFLDQQEVAKKMGGQ
jgi:major membrane immunogen (membrane-anchored lipoprotein)